MKRYLVTFVFLAACAPIVPDKPGATQSEFNVDQAQCQLSAKASEGGSAAAGDPNDPTRSRYGGCCGAFYPRTGGARPTNPWCNVN